MIGKCNLLLPIPYYLFPIFVWKTVPWWRAHSPLARSPGSKSITDNADATDLFFSRISFNLVLPLNIWFTTDCICTYTAQDSLHQEIIRDNHSARQAQTNHNRINKSVKRTNPSHPRYPWFLWTRRESRRRKSLSIRYCLTETKDPLLSQRPTLMPL